VAIKIQLYALSKLFIVLQVQPFWPKLLFAQKEIPASDQKLPAGLPVEDPNNDCSPIPDINPESSLKLGTESQNGVATGHDSLLEANVISSGRADLLRRIMHAAEGIAETELLVKGTVDVYVANGPVIQRLDDIEDQLTELEKAVGIVSGSDAVSSESSALNVAILSLLLMVLLDQHYFRRPHGMGI
jgi:hypothetical protein